jgi:hypothetical protein
VVALLSLVLFVASIPIAYERFLRAVQHTYRITTMEARLADALLAVRRSWSEKDRKGARWTICRNPASA